MGIRWLAILGLALLVTLVLAAGTAAGIGALLPLMMIEWIDDRWLRTASLVVMTLAPAVFLVRGYHRQRAKKSGRSGSPN